LKSLPTIVYYIADGFYAKDKIINGLTSNGKQMPIQEINQRYAVFIEAKKNFDDGEFSDNDVNLLETFCQKIKNTTEEQLFKITHRKNTLWYQTALKYNGIM
jgi:hypothetical protein